MYLARVFLTAALFALALPPLTAAEIHLPEPITDLTLVMHEPVSIQFPHGVTDRPETGEWKHQIKRKRDGQRTPLPAGLTYDGATRTLSGTPTEEHDEQYRYRVLHRWAPKAAGREVLLVPFRIIVQHPIEAHIRDFMGEARSVNQFVRRLPPLHKTNSIYMVASQALDQDFVSEDTPRMISFGATARTIFAWGSNATSPLYDTVEFLTADDQEWHLGVIDFAEDPPTVERDIESCQTCHNGHPLWAEYRVWPGTLFEAADMSGRLKRGWGHDQALLERYTAAADPRLSVVSARPQGQSGGHITVPEEFANQLAIRHGAVLANRAMASPEFDAIASAIVCGGYGVVRNIWPLSTVDIARMGTGDSDLRLVDLYARHSTDRLYHSGNAGLEQIVVLLLIHHLYEIDPAVQALYDRTSNTAFVPRHERTGLHFAPGTATAADELLSRVALVELEGQAHLAYRKTVGIRPGRVPGGGKDMNVGGHLDAMRGQVCAALAAEE